MVLTYQQGLEKYELIYLVTSLLKRSHHFAEKSFYLNHKRSWFCKQHTCSFGEFLSEKWDNFHIWIKMQLCIDIFPWLDKIYLDLNFHLWILSLLLSLPSFLLLAFDLWWLLCPRQLVSPKSLILIFPSCLNIQISYSLWHELSATREPNIPSMAEPVPGGTGTWACPLSPIQSSFQWIIWGSNTWEKNLISQSLNSLLRYSFRT